MTNLVAELRSWVGWPKKELDILLEQAADEVERLHAALGYFAGLGKPGHALSSIAVASIAQQALDGGSVEPERKT